MQALGQIRRTGYESDELAAAAAAVDFPGKDDETPYSRRRRFRGTTRAVAPDCPRGTHYPTGEGAVALSLDAVIDPSECAWVVARAEEAAASKWSVDHANKENIGTDKIWSKPFPDRLWLREVPGLLDWFEHRLRTRLFPMLQASAQLSARNSLGAQFSDAPVPMLQSLYPEAIPSSETLRCHAPSSRYDAGGMNSLEVRGHDRLRSRSASTPPPT